MYQFLHTLLGDRTGGEVFRCFGLWHIFWIGLAAGLFTVLYKALRSRNEQTRQKTLGALTDLCFGLYILDFFLMPLAYGEIDVEKLPFHACTAMCVLCFLSRRSDFLNRFRESFALLGFVSNFVYLLYPAGVMWHSVHPLCYRVIQTLLFHSLMSVACLLELLLGRAGSRWQHLTVTAAMTVWAMAGNYVYNTPDRLYNWFFVVRDPFYILPEHMAPFVMPVLNIGLFFAAEMAVCAAVRWARNREVRDAV
ncbi:MAG: YwaF family protein [Oscillospiraceae bacterium]|nr:YwaF family protein [Oscillospiraceae bacterium]